MLKLPGSKPRRRPCKQLYRGWQIMEPPVVKSEIVAKLGETETPVEILMVDDDELDYELFRRQLAKQQITNVLHHVYDGEDALTFLRNRQEKGARNPLVVLMDVNMPRMNGIDCVRALREDPRLKSTVVFMLTTSDDDRDVLEAYELNVAGYLVKGNLGTAFLEGIQLLDTYFRVVRLPATA